jgi:hypothetical protein
MECFKMTILHIETAMKQSRAKIYHILVLSSLAGDELQWET